MTKKVYRTAQGKIVDLGALQLRNENIRAVGNMSVNARGDLLDSNNRPIKSRTRTVSNQYNRQTTVAPEDQSTRPARRKPVKSETPPAPPEDFDDNFSKESLESSSDAKTAKTAEPSGTVTGLAAAIAKARQVRQDPLRTPRDVAKHQEGVKKL